MNDYINQAQGLVLGQLGPVWGPPAWSVTTALVSIVLVLVPLLLTVLN